MWTALKPLCSLLEWAEVINLNPYLVAQMAEPHDALGITGQCENPFYQMASNFADHLGREEIAEALIQAERLIQKQAMTYPAPKALSDEVLFPRDANMVLANWYAGSSGRQKSVKLKTGNLLSMGQYTESLISAGVAVVGSDPFSDGFNTFATVTVAVPAGTSADEVVLYLPASAIPAGYSRADCQVRPVKVSISGNVATITFKLLLLVKPALYLKMSPDILNAATAANYATTVDVYRRTIDLDESGSLIWEVGRDCDNPPCSYELLSGCFQPIDKRLGYVAPVPASFDSVTQEYERLFPNRGRAPDRVEVNYIAGIPLGSDGMLHPLWRSMTAKLATALLPAKSAGCAHADLRLNHYRSIPTDNDGNTNVPIEVINRCAEWFGVTGRGAIECLTMLTSEDLTINRVAYA